MSKRDFKILLVDDQRSIRDLARFTLEQAGLTDIEEASNGAKALQIVRAGKIDLVISDWNMEPMDGLQLLKTIRADGKIGKTPFIMMTAQADKKYVQMAAEAGVNNYVVKPFNAETVKKKIEQVMGKF